MTEENISWDDALTSGDYVSLEQDEPKVISIKNWKFEKVEKFGKEQIEFVSECTEEDGEKVDKKFTTASTRLKTKLRPLLENADVAKGVKLSIIKVGDKYSTQYACKLVE